MTELFRPVGPKELELIFDTDARAFPPRLPEQPIFYPVLNLEYAVEIARDWNAPGENRAGFATRFEVESNYVSRFEVKTVGARRHQELWVPAEELPEFNRHIVGRIQVVEAFFGEGFRGSVPMSGLLAGKDATEQAAVLAKAEPEALEKMIRGCPSAIQVNYAYWRGAFKGVAERVRSAWLRMFPDVTLPCEPA